jgi:hypothetical protein
MTRKQSFVLSNARPSRPFIALVSRTTAFPFDVRVQDGASVVDSQDITQVIP